MSEAEVRIWRAFHTKPRHEKAISERIEEKGIEVYCPLVETKVQWSDRLKRVKKPLFNGYLFVKVTEKERITVLEDPSVSRCVSYLGKPGVIRDEEIQAIRYILEEGDDVMIHNFQPGKRVRVASGQMKGASGEVIQISGSRIKVRIESLGFELIANVNAAKLDSLVS